jgi:hypothetical protein
MERPLLARKADTLRTISWLSQWSLQPSTTLAELVFAVAFHGLVYCSMGTVATVAEE